MVMKTIAALVAVALVVSTIIWKMTRDKPIRVALGTVERGEVKWAVSNTRAGTVNACKRARMAPILHGQIAALPVKAGDRVETGQILMQLWNEDLNASVELAEKQRLAAVSPDMILQSVRGMA